MKGWLTQPGYPIVNVTRRIDEASNEIIYELKQEYFLLYQSKKNKEKLVKKNSVLFQVLLSHGF